MLLYSLLNELITSNIFIVAYLAVTICSPNPCFEISDQLSNNLPEVRPKLHRDAENLHQALSTTTDMT